MTEAQLQTSLIHAAKQLGYRVYHAWLSQRSTPGFPDLTIVGHGTIFCWELKGPRGRVSDAQRAWIDDLVAAGIDARVIFPEDYDDALAALAAGRRAAA